MNADEEREDDADEQGVDPVLIAVLEQLWRAECEKHERQGRAWSLAKLSKQAFEILHTKYSKTPWAEKTKYWYGAN